MSEIRIPIYFDNLDKKIKSSSTFLNHSNEYISNLRTRHDAIRSFDGKGIFSCPECEKSIFIRMSDTPHFSHYADDQNDCQLKDSASINTMPRDIYSGEGALHIFWKLKLIDMLIRTSGVTDLKWERQATAVKSDGSIQRKFPDIQFQYEQIYFAFEVQNSWLSPSKIVEREIFYSQKGWNLIWLVTEHSLNPQTYRDINNVNSNSSYLCVLNQKLLDLWAEGYFCLSTRYTSRCMAIGEPPYIKHSYEYRNFSLEDCISSTHEIGLATGSILSLQENHLITHCGAIAPTPMNKSQPPNYRSLQIMASALNFHFGLESLDQMSRKLFRLIASIACGKILDIHLDWYEYLETKLDTKKWQRYMPLFMTAAAAYKSTTRFHPSIQGYAEKLSCGDIENDDIEQCGGKHWEAIKSFFPSVNQLLEALEPYEIAKLLTKDAP